jgi:hypothetical protein
MKYHLNEHTSGEDMGIDPMSIDGLVMYFDATTASTLTVDENNKVSAWRSRVSPTLDLIQVTDNLKPELVPSDDSLGCSAVEFAGDQVLVFNPGGQIISPTDTVFMGFLPTRFDITNSMAVLAGPSLNEIVGVQALGAPDNSTYVLRYSTAGSYVSFGHFTEYLESRVLTLLPNDKTHPARLDNYPIPIDPAPPATPIGIVTLGQGITPLGVSQSFTRVAFVAVFRDVNLYEDTLEGIAKFFRRKMGLVHYPAAIGGTSRLDGNRVVKVFDEDGDLNVIYPGSAELLLVGGGGGGGYGAGGGGGGGGFRNVNVTLTQEVYPISIGAGGGGATTTSEAGANGQPTTFGDHSALGGGGGGSPGITGVAGQDGGSGGGAPGGTFSFLAGSGTVGQGFGGGEQGTPNVNLPGSGGGGSASPGEPSFSPPVADSYVLGGYGLDLTIEGVLKTYSAGGRGTNSTYTGNGVATDLHNGQGGNGGGVGGAGQPGSTGVAVVKYAGRAFAYSNPFWDNLVLLIHGDGRDNSRYIIDSSAQNNHLVLGGRVRKSRKNYINRASIRFDRGVDDLIQASNPNFSPGTQDFSLSMWISIDVEANDGNPFGVLQLSNTVGGLDTDLTNSLTLGAKADFSWVFGDNLISTSPNSVRTQWQHIAIERRSGVTTFYIDGLEAGSAPDTNDYFGAHLCIGSNVNNTRTMLGNITDLQFVVGQSVYLEQFEPSSLRPLHGEDVKPDPYSDFVSFYLDAEALMPTAAIAYDQSRGLRVELKGRAHLVSDAYSGRQSFKFLGEPDSCLEIPRTYPSAEAFAFTTQDFCIEFRARKNYSVLGSLGKILSANTDEFALGSIGIVLDAYNGFSFNHNGFSLSAFFSCDDDQWHHYAVVKHDNVMHLYVDGFALASLPHSTSIGGSSSPSYYSIGKDFHGLIDNFRVTKQKPRYIGSFINPASSLLQLFGEREDKHFSKVVLLLPFDDLVYSNNILDRSVYAHENVNLDTEVYISNEYVTSIGYMPCAVVAVEGVPGLRFPQNSAFDLLGDFTIDFMARVTDEYASGYGTVMSTDPSNGAGLGGWFIELSTNRGLCMHGAGYSYIEETPIVGFDDQWHHYAIQRIGSQWYAYIDGVPRANIGTGLGNLPLLAGADLTIGQVANGSYPFKGRLKNIRVTNGVARYPASLFVPDFGPLPRSATESVSLLSKTSFVLQGLEADFASKVTESGHVAVEGAPDSVVIDNENYVDGALYFNGTTESRYEFDHVYYLEDGKPYCIEFYVHPNPTANDNLQVVMATSNLIGAEGGWGVELSTVNGLRFVENVDTPQMLSTVFPFDNREHHVAIARFSSGDLVIYIDGVVAALAAGVLPTQTKIGVLSIGNTQGGLANAFVGRVRGVRITLGSARYAGSSFPVPELPYYEATLTPAQLYGHQGGYVDFSRPSTVTLVSNKIAESVNLYPYQSVNKLVQPTGGFQLDYLRSDEVNNKVAEGNKTGFLPFSTPIPVVDMTVVVVGKFKGTPEDTTLSAALGSAPTGNAVFGWQGQGAFTLNGNAQVNLEVPGLFSAIGSTIRALENKGYSVKSVQQNIIGDDVTTPSLLISNPDEFEAIGRYGGSEFWWLAGQIGELAVTDRAVPSKRLEALLSSLQRKWLVGYLFDGRPEMIVAPTAYSGYPGSNSSTPGTWRSDTPLTFAYAWRNSEGVVVGTDPGFSIYAYVGIPLWLTITVTNSVGSVEWKSAAVYMMGDY